ncbi:S-layer homology domain-containing protein [Anaerovorax odorimutans]|uniref:S-layer homology domain-containing protein n=1 Tax=Anaerovorax odorimutans TaxID=109327 RepID=UPI00040AAA4A|nr:S-layer homology domain-containing protein [Anaerovorax odorimutans]
MKKKFLGIVLIFCMVLSLLPAMNVTAHAGSVEVWDGTASTSLNVVDTNSTYDADSNPLAISSGADLAYMHDQVNAGKTATIKYTDINGSENTITAYNASYQLTTNLVLNENTTDYETWAISAPANIWTPIGNAINPFAGTFDGDNHTVSGMYINNNSGYTGMFGYIAGGKVQNLGVINSYISGDGDVGGVAGSVDINEYNGVFGALSNCYNSAYVTSNISGARLGGVVGVMAGTISDCYNTANIIDDSTIKHYRGVGGVAGNMLYCTASNCYNTGTIRLNKSGISVGGVVGESRGEKLVGCYNTGEITVNLQKNSGWTGGVLGSSRGEVTMTDCYNTGNIKCTDGYESRAGGVLGDNSDGSIAFANCYNTGNIVSKVSTFGAIGGILGNSVGSKLTNCYNTGSVLGIGNSSADVGGISGILSGQMTNCYNTGNVNGAAPKAGIGGIAGYVGSSISRPSRYCYWLLSANQEANSIQREDVAKVAMGSYRYSSITYYAGEEGYSDNLASAGITDCYSFSGSDTTWTLSNNSDYSVTPASNGDAITLSSNASLLTVLNAWVDTEAYYHWQVDNEYEPDNSGYPLLGIAGSVTITVTDGYGESKDKICTGATLTATSNTTPDTNITYQWEVSKNGLTGWSDATGVGNSTEIYTVAVKDAGKYLRVKVTSADAPRSVYSDTMYVPYLITILQSANTTSDAISFSDTDSVTTTYATGSAVTIYYTLDSSGKASNTLSYSGGTITRVTTAGTGNSSYVVSDRDSSNGVITITATFAHSNSTVGGSSHSSSSKSGATDNSSSGTSVIVNGTAYTAGTEKDTVDNDRTVTTVTVDADKLGTTLETQRNNVSVVIPITSGSDVASGVLNGQMVKNMERKDATLEIQTDRATYTLPASEIQIESVAEKFGADISLSDISVQITIAQPSDDIIKIVENAEEEGSLSIMVKPVEFTVNCTYGEDTTEVRKFNSYVSRTIVIPENVDVSKITTAIVVNEEGTTHHVPTKITKIDGTYYAEINSLTNSVYTLINNEVQFADVEGHWAQNAIDDMASRMVVTGMGNGNYNPNSAVTRAQFAAIVVRALGLEEGVGLNTFSDVSQSDWYCGCIGTAWSYGIISGYADGNFAPKDKITREQAMMIMARAMNITKLNVELSDSDITTLLGGYLDDGNISKYARESTAVCIKSGIISGKGSKALAPKDNMTRAEVAVIVQRLLQKSELI